MFVRLFSLLLTTAALPAAPALAALDQPACERLKASRVLRKQAPVGCDRLTVVRFPYIDFSGAKRDDGELMVLDAVAPEVSQLFHALHRRRFPLAQARLIDHYGGDDEASMRDNNTSAFNQRAVTGGGPPSLHAYGLAIDINPAQNPFLQPGDNGTVRVSPPAGAAYLNRRAARPGKPPRSGMAEDVIGLFAAAGFTVWGGDWDTPLDYQHFQFSRELAQRLAALPEREARQLYLRQIKAYRNCLGERRSNAGTACAFTQAP
ncbi:M15 family metallopeptidase [Noviherbaspirillum soli]|uniref:M15 family metallopeptidase n=1 Tax=Noviherbaspirillum soli TaxID=1064518 RepID=UPI001E5B9638|nr:M15 family metallopeptidase [Noviherbaspirillum soli]